ncbi:MAG: hypothetical protein QNL16_06155 [Rhodobacterales bacterium]
MLVIGGKSNCGDSVPAFVDAYLRHSGVFANAPSGMRIGFSDIFAGRQASGYCAQRRGLCGILGLSRLRDFVYKRFGPVLPELSVLNKELLWRFG